MNKQPRKGQMSFGGGKRGMNFEKPKDTVGTLKRLVKYIGSSKKLFISLLITIIISSVLTITSPIFQGKAIDLITLDENKLSVDFENLFKILIILVIIFIFNAIFNYFKSLLSSYLSQKTVVKMRKDLFDHMLYLPVKFTDNHQHGDLMSRMTNDVDNISNTISQSIGSLISAIFTILGSLIVMIVLNIYLTLVSLVSVFLTILVTSFLSKKMRKYYQNQQKLLGEINGHTEEMVTGYKTVTCYSKEEDVKNEFNEISNKLRKTSIKANIFGGIMGPVMNLIGNFGFLLVVFLGAYLLVNKITIGGVLVSIGTIQTFINLSKQFSRPINEIAQLWAQIQTAMAGAERVFEIMDASKEIDEGTKEFNYQTFKGNIDFNHIHFSYVEGREVLTDFDLHVKQGEKLAIVGATGSGKTTIVNLLMRFYDPEGGEILIDGENINNFTKKSLRSAIAIVLQDTSLFGGTVMDNIKFGCLNATNEEAEECAKLANADYFIKNLKEEYNTVLTESGGNLSEGQRQLLSIARAIIANPKILILDEATSSVDTRTEKNIQDGMIKLMENRTSFIIAHRLSTIQDADNIIVIDKGKVVEKGNHYELLEEKGVYYNLYQTQFAGNQI